MSAPRPNILLLMTDEHRADSLGIAGHPAVQTPHLDAQAARGVLFDRAYTPCPVCVPARRSLLTGQTPGTHGVFADTDAPLHAPTLPGELTRAGYQAHLVGKLHLWPQRARHGFASMDWADGPRAGVANDYQRFLVHEGGHDGDAHGLDGAWVVRPWHLDERLHFTNWCASRAVDFLERRDPTCPFFLMVSFFHPHYPLTPPRDYYARYLAMDLPEPYVGEWARVFAGPQRGLNPEGPRVCLEAAIMHQYRAAYYAAINHIDDQIARVLHHIPEDTIVVFVSDHGEMLGDHQWVRKRLPYEPSARVPFFARFPDRLGIPQRRVVSDLVGLQDVMPTVLDAAGVPIPASVEGRSLLPRLRGETDWRDTFHGECAEISTHDTGMQFLTDARWKYIWFPGTGVEQLFDLAADPHELHDLAGDARDDAEIRHWRGALARELAGRPEGFSDGHTLARLSGPTGKSSLSRSLPLSAGER